MVANIRRKKKDNEKRTDWLKEKGYHVLGRGMGKRFLQGSTKMLILGHTGITLGAATLLNKVIDRRLGVSNWPVRQKAEVRNLAFNPRAINLRSLAQNLKFEWFTSLGKRIDIRILPLGSLLPDIIDKPLGIVFLDEILGNGRAFAHTLLFLVIIGLIGFFLCQSRKKLWLLILSFGTFMHLILDQMWLTPQTLLWPLYGFFFPKREVEFISWLKRMFYALHTSPDVYIPEIIGGAILIWFVLTVIHQRKIYSFIKIGNL